MKYIRTKDGIFEIIKQNNSYVMVKGKYLQECKLKRKEDKQADTIEELVDFVAVKLKWEELPSVHSLKELYKKVEEQGRDKNTVFDNHEFLIEKSRETHSVEYIRYAIATDKGLIYVAEMNDKGVLELL